MDERPADIAFPKDFVWGAATASYQIEGAAFEDGKGLSVWDAFSRRPGAVFEGHNGDVACDHYHRYREDLALMKALGLGAYRFSVSWPRVLPEGTGAVNPKGLDFYERLIDGLLELGIRPMCTLFHWDLPLELQRRGGFLNRDMAGWFADYADLLAKRFGDRVDSWITQNEPQCYIGLGYLDGVHAPGLRLDHSEYLLAAHNSMRAHGQAVRALRAHTRAPVGYVLATQLSEPATEDAADLAAARAATFAVHDRSQWNNTWWLDPIVRGAYPEDGVQLYGRDMPAILPGDLEQMRAPLDFIGLNIYKSELRRATPDGGSERLPVPPGYPRSAVDWQPITPAALYWGPRFFHERYDLPLCITENGLSTRDQVFLDGKVHDPQRVDYLHRALLELGRAIAEGVRVTGYMAWSLLDNFEWADGYKQRFGLIYVDYPSLVRIPKDSFYFYRDVIASNGRILFEPTQVPARQVTAPAR